jgi:hypothetical protein
MSRSELAWFQENLVKYIQEGGALDSLSAAIIPAGQLTAAQALQVYRADFVSRMTHALGATYETIWAVLGDEDFFSLCETYCSTRPSSVRNLMDYGEDFSDFLQQQPVAAEWPFLPSLASFEWDYWELFHQAQALPTSEEVSGLNEELLAGAVLHFRPELRLLRWEYRLIDLWKMRHVGFKETTPDWDAPQRVLMFRRGNQVALEELTFYQAQLCERLMASLPVESAVEDFLGTPEEVQDLFMTFSRNRLFSLSPQKT